MSNLLGIDFGLKRVGLALATSKIAEPYSVLSGKTVFEEIIKIIEKEKIQKVVIGISEGEMAANSKEFGEELKVKINIPVEFFDETLTTLDAQSLAIESGMNRRKRKEMIDAMAAAVMLQSYLDSN
jgi:putative Holliday junction resolvase